MSGRSKKAAAEPATQKKKSLAPHLEEIRDYVHIGPTHAQNVNSCDSQGAFLGDDSFDIANFKEGFSIKIQPRDAENKDNDNEIVFDMIGVDAPIANAFRRILLAEVPTMAIEDVYITNNTSVMYDEVLAHRLGLLPIKVDPRFFEERKGGSATDANMLVFELDVQCSHAPGTEDKYIHGSVYTRDLKWKPEGNQRQQFPDGVKFVSDDILICKLRPGQAIQLTAHAVRGIGRDHAKFSPVCTASYRLLPHITFQPKLQGEAAQLIKNLCPRKVFDIDDDGVLTAARVRDCSMCRECIREQPGRLQQLGQPGQAIKLLRRRNHFIFSVESTGALPAAELFREAVRVLIAKCDKLLVRLQNATNTTEDR